MQRIIDVDALSQSGFGISEDLRDADSDWHVHRKHQLLYAAGGMLHLGLKNEQWLLPPQRAAWIAAGVPHRVKAASADLRTVYLAPPLLEGPLPECCVFNVTPLAREMLLYAMRWGADRAPDDEVANRYFSALAALVREWSDAACPYRLPTAQTQELSRAMQFALDHLAEPVGIEDAARVAGVSPRTLARRFADETRSTWRQFLHNARLIKAMELLAVRGARVTEVAFSVGFESLAAFTRAFEAFTGECPKDYRRRVAGTLTPSEPPTPQAPAEAPARA